MNRREVLKLGGLAAAVGGLFGPRGASAQVADVPPGEPWTLAVEIPGAPAASRHIREVHIDDLHVDAREMTTGHDVEYWIYGPGQAHWGSATFKSAVTPDASKELRRWFRDAAKGKNVRKNITVILSTPNGGPGRVYKLLDCRPVRYSVGDFTTGAESNLAELRVTPTRVELG